MDDETIWMPLVDELDRWHAAGRVADLWLRDDDAVAPTAALDRLLELTADHGIPVTLAVIPQHTGAPLVHRLEGAAHAEVAVHGWSHVNHAPATEKKQELGSHRPVDAMIAELDAGFRHLADLHAPRFVPILVPPWNRISADLISRLPPVGFRTLSVFGPERETGMRMLNTHVDIMDWHGTGGGRPFAPLVEEITARLRTTFERGGAMGLLTHHLVHDDQAWAFLAAFFARTARHPGCRWQNARALSL